MPRGGEASSTSFWPLRQRSNASLPWQPRPGSWAWPHQARSHKEGEVRGVGVWFDRSRPYPFLVRTDTRSISRGRGRGVAIAPQQGDILRIPFRGVRSVCQDLLFRLLILLLVVARHRPSRDRPRQERGGRQRSSGLSCVRPQQPHSLPPSQASIGKRTIASLDAPPLPLPG